MIRRISELYGRLLTALALAACALLLAMVLIICADVLFRNARMGILDKGLPWSNEVTEIMLYLITLFTAPWLLRQGQHIRIDIVLRGLPRQLAWGIEWLCDVLALGCSLVIAWYGVKATVASFSSNSMVIKSFVFPEWWLLAPLPAAFVLLAIEMLFRMHRLYLGPRAPRTEAASAA